MSANPDRKKHAITFWLLDGEIEQLNSAVDRVGLTRAGYLRLMVKETLNQRKGVAFVPPGDSDHTEPASSKSLVTFPGRP